MARTVLDYQERGAAVTALYFQPGGVCGEVNYDGIALLPSMLAGAEQAGVADIAVSPEIAVGVAAEGDVGDLHQRFLLSGGSYRFIATILPASEVAGPSR